MCHPGHPLTPSTHGPRVAWRVLTVGHCSQGAVYDGDPAVEGTVHPPSVGAGGGEAGLARRGEGTARLGGVHDSRVSNRDTRLVLSATWGMCGVFQVASHLTKIIEVSIYLTHSIGICFDMYAISANQATYNAHKHFTYTYKT